MAFLPSTLLSNAPKRESHFLPITLGSCLPHLPSIGLEMIDPCTYPQTPKAMSLFSLFTTLSIGTTT